MKKALLKVAVMLLCLAGVTPAMAQFNLKKAVGGAVKAAKAVTLTDEQMTELSLIHIPSPRDRQKSRMPSSA